MRAPIVALAVVLATPATALAGPAADDVSLLRTRPTGMEEEEWRQKRREAARSLGDSRSEEAVTALIEVVETERYDAVLSIAIESLARQGDPRAIPPLQKVYADRSIDTFIREAAGKAIESLGGTPRDDARLVGGAGAAGVSGGATPLEGPQLGTMGEASVEEDDFEEIAGAKKKRPLPGNLRARDRDIAVLLGDVSLAVNAPLQSNDLQRDAGFPILADLNLGVAAAYTDERHQWGWSANGLLDFSLRNGDLTTTPDSMGNDDGNVLFMREGLAGAAEAHYYFGKTDVHVFGGVGLSQRLNVARIEDVESTGFDDSELSSTRAGLDIIPNVGLGWGRYLNAGSDLQVDAIVAALEAENILARPLDDAARREIKATLYRHANSASSYPRVGSVLNILQKKGYLARRPGTRLVHRVRSITEDPSYLERMKGIRVRAGFLFGAALLQDDRFLRTVDDNGERKTDHTGAPFVQFDAGFQLDREKQILADLRFWYDAVGPLKGFTTDAGLRYTRFLHSPYDDYLGQWYAGARGGVSQRNYPDDVDLDGDGDPTNDDVLLGYRAVAEAGYQYAFRRGSVLAVGALAGVDSGRLLVGLNLSVRLGIVRSGVYLPAAGGAAARGARKNRKKGPAVGASGTVEAGTSGEAGSE